MRKKPIRQWMLIAAVALASYGLLAYIVVPLVWDGVHKIDPAVADLPGVTQTANGLAGDPINVAIVGDRKSLMTAMVAAKWYPANPLTLSSCLEIAEATVLSRPYRNAPVSSLYYFGRKEDLAFEKPVGDNPRERHHVRFWLAPPRTAADRSYWLGAATFDTSVGLSETTLQLTHHISPAVDKDRGLLSADLEAAGAVTKLTKVAGFHKVLAGRNGEDDPWHTDGVLYVLELR